MFIQTETTADPDRLTFLPGQQVLPAGTLEITDPQAAVDSALAARLFEVPGVSSGIRDRLHHRHQRRQRLATSQTGSSRGDHGAFHVGRAGSQRGGAKLFGGDQPQDPTGLASKVKDALRRVIDPELGYNIVDLGLIYDIRVLDGGAVSVTMTTTTPGCPATSYLTEGARDCVLSVEGAVSAEIVLTHEPPWSPELMSGDAKAHLGIRTG